MSENHGAARGTSGHAGGPDLWNDEEDNFFGHSGTIATTVASDVVDADTPISTSTRGKKRKAGTKSVPRGRKSTAGRKNLEKGVTKTAAHIGESTPS
jgi:DNA helicase INO80